MSSMARRAGRGQEVPDRERGIVVGVDVSKRRIEYGAFAPGERGRVQRAEQDADGFAAFGRVLRQLQAEGKPA